MALRLLLFALALAGCFPRYVPGPPLAERERAVYAADNPITQVKRGMTTRDVERIMGPPSAVQMPMNNTGAVWRYRGRGRITLLSPAPFTLPEVIGVEVDPDERG